MSRSQRTEEQTDRLFRGTVGRSAVLVAALVALQSTAFCQGDEKPRIAFADQETCGDPRLESQLWRSVTGVVKEVASPTTIRILVSEPSPHVLTVKLLGVRSPAGRKSARDAISFLRRTAEGHSVTISLGLSDKYSERPKAQRWSRAGWRRMSGQSPTGCPTTTCAASSSPGTKPGWRGPACGRAPFPSAKDYLAS